jgi:hypothetical protein
MNEKTMQHFIRRLRDNGQDHEADRIEREVYVKENKPEETQSKPEKLELEKKELATKP